MANHLTLPELDAGWFADAALEQPLSPSLADIFKSDADSGAESGLHARAHQVLANPRPPPFPMHMGLWVSSYHYLRPLQSCLTLRQGPPGDYASFQRASPAGGLPSPHSPLPALQPQHLSAPQSIPAARPGPLHHTQQQQQQQQQQPQQQQRQSPTGVRIVHHSMSPCAPFAGSLWCLVSKQTLPAFCLCDP